MKYKTKLTIMGSTTVAHKIPLKTGCLPLEQYAWPMHEWHIIQIRCIEFDHTSASDSKDQQLKEEAALGKDNQKPLEITGEIPLAYDRFNLSYRSKS